MVVTLWGATAEEVGVQLEQQPEALISISTCRVTDYNGAFTFCLMPSSFCTMLPSCP